MALYKWYEFISVVWRQSADRVSLSCISPFTRHGYSGLQFQRVIELIDSLRLFPCQFAAFSSGFPLTFAIALHNKFLHVYVKLSFLVTTVFMNKAPWSHNLTEVKTVTSPTARWDAIYNRTMRLFCLHRFIRHMVAHVSKQVVANLKQNILD